MNLCTQCTTVPGKYHCPKCPALYCSVSCYQLHKEQCVSPNTNQQQSESNNNITTTESISTTTNSTTMTDEQSTDDIIIPPMFRNNPRVRAIFQQKQIDAISQSQLLTQQQLLSMLKNEALINTLHDPDLQKIIITITNAPHPEWQLLYLRHQMELNHDFCQFIEGLLMTLNVPQHMEQLQQQQEQDKALSELKQLFTPP